MRAVVLSIALCAPALAVAGNSAPEALRACLQSKFTIELLDVVRDKNGSTIVYKASNDLDWEVGATYLGFAYLAPKRYVRENSVFPVQDGLAAGETRVLRAKSWHSFPAAVRPADIDLGLVDVFDAQKHFLIGDGISVHNWPETPTKQDCTP